MNKLKLIAFGLAVMMSSTMLAGCSKNDTESSSIVEDAELEICDFEDFTFLMYTDSSGVSVIRDADGNKYTLSSDGYYYTADGEKITEYGAGDINTVNNASSLGATLKSQIKGGSSSNGSVSKEGNADGSYEEAVISEDLIDKDNPEVISDWDTAKKQIMENAGVIEEDTEPWHGVTDTLKEYQADEGDTKIDKGGTYDTAIDLGVSIPGVLKLDTVEKTKTGTNITYTVKGSLTLDGDAFNEYMKSIYGDTQIVSEEVVTEETAEGETDEEVAEDDTSEETEVEPVTEQVTMPADYASYIKTQYCTVYLEYLDGYSRIDSGIQQLYFDDNYSVSFSATLTADENTPVYLYIQGRPYNI